MKFCRLNFQSMRKEKLNTVEENVIKKKKKKKLFSFTPCIPMQRSDSKNKRVLTVIPRQRGEDDYV